MLKDEMYVVATYIPTGESVINPTLPDDPDLVRGQTKCVVAELEYRVLYDRYKDAHYTRERLIALAKEMGFDRDIATRISTFDDLPEKNKEFLLDALKKMGLDE